MTGKGATMDVGAWLRGLGLEKYEAAFRENEIDETVLPSLTHETLKELGVTAVGHRLKLLDNIAALRDDRSAKAPQAETAPIPDRLAQDSAERRQVTVMFSDLVGSTALSARMDPEDLREVISAYQKCVAETVQRFGGFVAKYMGDGVLVYFGYPQAHEDDAERAVRAGLEVTHAVGGLKSSAQLETRVGIATGLVVVGDLIGSGEAQERCIVGETPNVAARLQGIAETNSVVIAMSSALGYRGQHRLHVTRRIGDYAEDGADRRLLLQRLVPLADDPRELGLAGASKGTTAFGLWRIAVLSRYCLPTSRLIGWRPSLGCLLIAPSQRTRVRLAH
jgi:class 3 adenylate cyclase